MLVYLWASSPLQLVSFWAVCCVNELFVSCFCLIKILAHKIIIIIIIKEEEEKRKKNREFYGCKQTIPFIRNVTSHLSSIIYSEYRGSIWYAHFIHIFSFYTILHIFSHTFFLYVFSHVFSNNKTHISHIFKCINQTPLSFQNHTPSSDLEWFSKKGKEKNLPLGKRTFLFIPFFESALNSAS